MTRWIPFLTLAVALGCATTPSPEPLPSRAVELGPNDSLKVDHVVLVSDGSHSMTKDGKIIDERLLVESFVSGMPEGSYGARGILFGGNTRKETAGGPLDRTGLAHWASAVRYVDPTTPIGDVLGTASSRLAGRDGRDAIVLFSDGISTWGNPEDAIAQAKAAGQANPGLCIYTVQIGNDPEGKRLLESLAGATGCGGSTNGSALRTASGMNDFQRSIFVATAAQAPRMAPPTAGPDPCAGVLRLRGVNFAFDKADIRPEDEVLLDEAARMLEMCGSKRVRIEGHTDSTGPEAYNQGLSQRRAQSVTNYLIGKGISSGRLQPVGRGEGEPVASNATREGRALNRRVDFEFLQ